MRIFTNTLTPLKKDLISIGFIIIIILLCYHGLFSGANFFVEEDPLTVYGYSHGNAIGNGWRPDKGFGISFFFGDPGAFHAWSVFSLLEKIIPAPESVYNASVVFLLILTAVSQYLLLRRIVPALGIVNCLLAPLIVFGPLQHEFFFQRHWIALSIGTPLLLILIYDYFRKPKVLHLFQGALLFWFVLFFGSFASFLQLFIVGTLFSGLFYIYHKSSFKNLFGKYVLFYASSVFWTVTLGAWCFYSILMESRIVGYVRETAYLRSGLLNVKLFFNSLIGLLHSGWLPSNIVIAGGQFLPIISWENVSVVFPLILVFFLFRRSSNFWEFSLKSLLVILIVHQILMDTFPFYSNLLQLLVNGYPLSKFPPAYHCFQICLIGIFISKMSDMKSLFNQNIMRKIQKLLAFLLVIFYISLGVISIFSLMLPGVLPKAIVGVMERLIPNGIGGYPKDLLAYVIRFNMKQIEESIHWYLFCFYFLSAILILPFIKDRWLSKVARMPSLLIVGLLFLNGVLLSWGVYPLNKKELVWEQKSLTSVLSRLKPTTRFYNFLTPAQKTKKTLESFKKNWIVRGGLKYKVGSWSPPALNFSSVKSFCQKDVAQFTYNIFNKNEKKHIRSLRELAWGAPLIFSELFNMGAVSYCYSSRELSNPPAFLSPYFKSKQLYIYKNLSAWPYFYLAKRMEIKKDEKHLEEVQYGTTYVDKEDFSQLAQNSNSTITLKEFSYGKLVFDYHGENENFLVVADAWHPFWKAKIDNKSYPVVRANEIFKGIHLPKGKYTVTLYFDTSPFYTGIYISILTWILFLSGLIFVLKSNWNIKFLQ